MPVVLANDGSFGGWGIALCAEDGPRRVAHVRLETKSYRWAAYLDALEETVDPFVGDAALLAADRGERPRLVVERVPDVMGGGFAKKRRPNPFGPPEPPGRDGNGVGAANPTLTSFGLGLFVGPLMLYGARPGWSYPWDVKPGEWRAWWRFRGVKGRVAFKRAAVETVRLAGWGRFLEPFPEKGEDLGPRGDVAEAILLGVGAARNERDAPTGPAKGVRKTLLVVDDSIRSG